MARRALHLLRFLRRLAAGAGRAVLWTLITATLIQLVGGLWRARPLSSDLPSFLVYFMPVPVLAVILPALLLSVTNDRRWFVSLYLVAIAVLLGSCSMIPGIVDVNPVLAVYGAAWMSGLAAARPGDGRWMKRIALDGLLAVGLALVHMPAMAALPYLVGERQTVLLVARLEPGPDPIQLVHLSRPTVSEEDRRRMIDLGFGDPTPDPRLAVTEADQELVALTGLTGRARIRRSGISGRGWTSRIIILSTSRSCPAGMSVNGPADGATVLYVQGAASVDVYPKGARLAPPTLEFHQEEHPGWGCSVDVKDGPRTQLENPGRPPGFAGEARRV